MKNILLLENDVFLANSLVKTLEHIGYKVTQARSIARACDLVHSYRYDLVLCDRMLDDGDGFEIVKYLHSCNHSTRIIMLTKKKKLKDKLEGFEEGVDDYLTKPFFFKELSARIKNLLNKEKVSMRNTMKVGMLDLLIKKGIVITPTSSILLRKKETAILMCLFQHKNTIVTRNQLIDAVWPDIDTQPTQGTVDVYIRRIRMKMGKYGSLLKTARGYGYRIVDSYA